MQDAVHKWKQSGHVWLWTYGENQRNYPGWHMTADATGAASVSALLTLFADTSIRVHRTLALSKVSSDILAVPNNRGGAAAWTSPRKWRLEYAPEIENANIWEFAPNGETLTFTLGRRMLQPLRQAIEGLPCGKGDYSISSTKNGEPLWFWWQPKHAA